MFARSARISSAARRDTQRAAGRWGWHCHLSPSRLPPSPAPNEHLGAAPGVQGFLSPGSGTNPARHEGSGGSAGSSAGLHPLTCRQRGAHTAVYPGVMRSHSPPQGTRALHRLSSNRGTAASNRCPRFAPLRPRAAQRPTASSSATPTAAPSPAAPPQPRVGPRGRGSPPRAPRYLLGPLSALAAAAAALAPLAAVAPAGRLVAHRCPAPLRGRRRRAMGASRRRGRHPRGGAGTGTEGGDGGKGRDEEGRGGGRRGAALPGDTGRRAAGGPRREGAALRGSQRGCGAEAAGVVSEAAGRRPCPVSGRSCTNSAPPQS